MKKMTLVKFAPIALMACVVILHPATAQTHKTKGTGTKSGTAKSAGIMNTWTVSGMQPAGKGSDYIKVTFITSNKIYKLSPKADPAYAKRLKESMDKHTAVYVKRANEQSDMILSVIVPGVPGQKKKKATHH